jgi:hypothetical protein
VCIAARKKRAPAPEYFITPTTPTLVTFLLDLYYNLSDIVPVTGKLGLTHRRLRRRITLCWDDTQS